MALVQLFLGWWISNNYYHSARFLGCETLPSSGCWMFFRNSVGQRLGGWFADRSQWTQGTDVAVPLLIGYEEVYYPVLGDYELTHTRETYQSTSTMRCARVFLHGKKDDASHHNSCQDSIWAQMGRYSKSWWFPSCSLEKRKSSGIGVHNFLDTATIVVPTFGFDGFPSSCWSILRYFWLFLV